jgi:hypothetical protein
MRDLVRLIVWMVADLFRSRTALEVEIWMLRQQINVLRRTAPKKQTFSAIDRLILFAFIGFSLAFAMRWRLLSRRPWSNGIAPASVYIGDGNRKRGVAGQQFRWRYASLSAR